MNNGVIVPPCSTRMFWEMLPVMHDPTRALQVFGRCWVALFCQGKWSTKIINMIRRSRNAHPFPFQTTTIKLSCFAQLEILLRQQAPFRGVPSHASKIQYRDTDDQKNLRDQKEADDDSNDSDSDDSDVDSSNGSDDD